MFNKNPVPILLLSHLESYGASDMKHKKSHFNLRIVPEYVVVDILVLFSVSYFFHRPMHRDDIMVLSIVFNSECRQLEIDSISCDDGVPSM